LWIINEYVEKQCQNSIEIELSVVVAARIDGIILRAIFLESGDFLISAWIETTRSSSMERRTVVASRVVRGLKQGQHAILPDLQLPRVRAYRGNFGDRVSSALFR
jgi:hypothetical protein